MTAREAIALYRAERKAAKHRLAAAKKVEVAAAKAEYQRHLDAQLAAGRGGRPKGSKNGQRYATPHRMPTHARRCDPGDELIVALGHFGGAA